jgi:hypothetical protein
MLAVSHDNLNFDSYHIWDLSADKECNYKAITLLLGLNMSSVFDSTTAACFENDYITFSLIGVEICGI